MLQHTSYGKQDKLTCMLRVFVIV